MAKKQLTMKQKQNKYRRLQYITLASEYVSIVTPFAIMAVVNRKEWFPEETGWRTGFGFTLACLLLSIIISSITFENEKLNNRKGKYIKVLIGTVIAAFVFFLLRDIMNEIGSILLFASIGIAGALGLDLSSADFKAKADTYGEIIRDGKKEVLKKEYEEEIKDLKDIKF